MQSGTAATIIKLEDVPTDALRLTPLVLGIDGGKTRLKLTLNDLRKDIDWGHIRGVGTGMVLRTWLRYIPALAPFRADVERMFTEEHCKHALRLRKSEIYSLRCSALDEASNVGTWAIIKDLVSSQLGITLDWLNDTIIPVCGDQLTIAHIRKVRTFRRMFADTSADRAEPFVPIIQLWHMKWTLQKGIFNLGYKSDTAGRGVFGMHHDAVLLGRDSTVKREDFYPRHHFLSDRFDTMVLEALRSVACAQEFIEPNSN